MVFFNLLIFFALHWLEVAGVKSVITPSYLWPLRYTYNKKVPVVPPLDIHGDVMNDNFSLHFDGKTTWLDAGELTGSCIAQPDKCTNGLSVAMRVKLSGNASVSQSPQFLFDSGGFNGQGVSLYLKNGELYGEVADKKRFWRATTKLEDGQWHFVLLTWSAQDGVMLFVDGPIRSQNSQPISFQLNPVATSNHVMIGKCNAEMGSTLAEFSSDLVALFDSITPDGKIYLSYSFSAPSSRGNIRYVNAKFINTAEFDLIIFPDRGEHQKDGYQLEAHSSTLLEYVLREGPLPIGMNFRLQNKGNGEQLRYNGSYDFHVISSDDKQVIKQYRILQDGSILSSTSTAAVSINYQIRSANISIEHVSVGGGSPAKAGAESPSAEEPEALKNNPENPLNEDTIASNTSMNATAPQEGNTTSGASQINQTEKATKEPFSQMTTTIAPTLPPPPQYTTRAPNKTSVNETKNWATTNPYQGGDIDLSNPEMPDEGESLGGINTTGLNNTQLNGTDAELDALFNENEKTGNVTSGGRNETSTGTLKMNNNDTSNGTSNGTSNVGGNVSSAEITKTGTNNSDTNNITGTSNGSNNDKSDKGVSQIQSELNAVNLKNKDRKGPAITNLNSLNPWLQVAKQTQNQQQQPILWQNGQGIFNAIHASNKLDGMGTVKYHNEEKLKLGERPVWQYLNEPQNNQWLSNNRFKTDSNAVGTSPFKFANTKTQEEATSFYNQKKDNKPRNQQTGVTEDDATLFDSF
ncbi:putative uncharacterized protein DDB_G0282133 [Rhopilema esculentum]|uniref:putative uncharacterized protein DDB_G0282133 n=1 Tax=Rhopilema esculentum TaxID=499914 RepID=UPI0031D643F1